MDSTSVTDLQCRARELPEEAPFWERSVTLGMMVEGQLFSSHAIGDKELLIGCMASASAIVATWHGTHYSSLFTVSRERLARELERRMSAKAKRR